MKSWFASNATLRLDSAVQPRARVLCFHGAGCDASLFITKGTPAKPLPNPLIDFCVENEVELLSFQMPGRGNRYGEARFTDALQAAESVMGVLEPLLTRKSASQVMSDVPLVVVGHSLGALIAYEFTCLMRRKGLTPPRNLIVACMCTPNLGKDERPWPPVSTLDDSQLREELKIWGANEEVFKPGVWEVFEPIFRADFQILDNYVFAEPEGSNFSPAAGKTTTNSPSTKSSDSPKPLSFHAPLSGVDTLVVHASKDRRITEEFVAGWVKVVGGTALFSSSPSGFGTAGGKCSSMVIDGDHNFLYDPEPRKIFLNRITEILDQALIDAEYGCF